MLLALAAAVALQRLDRHRVEVDDTPAAAGLGNADHFDAIHHGRGLVHGHRAAREVEVGPAEGDELAAAHAGQGEEAEHRSVAVAVDRLEEAGQLARRPDGHLRRSGTSGRQRRGARQAGDVAGHDAGALGVVEQLVERGVDVVHAAHREATAAATAGAQQLGVHRVEVGGAKLLQRRVAEPGQHVVREDDAVALQRRRLAALVGQPVEPRLDELGQRRAARSDEAAALVGGEEAGQLGLRIALGAERSLRAGAGDRPPATWRGRPTTRRRRESSGGRSCRWPRPNRTPDGYHSVTTEAILGESISSN